jgi:hypothetical protein
MEMLKQKNIDFTSMTDWQRLAAFNTNQPMLLLGVEWRDDLKLADVRMFGNLMGHYFAAVRRSRQFNPVQALGVLVAAASTHTATNKLLVKGKSILPLVFHYKNFSEALAEQQMPQCCLEGVAMQITAEHVSAPAASALPSVASLSVAPVAPLSLETTALDDFPKEKTLQYAPFDIPEALMQEYAMVPKTPAVTAKTKAKDKKRLEQLEWKYDMISKLIQEIRYAQEAHPVHNRKVGTQQVFEHALAQLISIRREMIEIKARGMRYVKHK